MPKLTKKTIFLEKVAKAMVSVLSFVVYEGTYFSIFGFVEI
jgi:hypothetical protein